MYCTSSLPLPVQAHRATEFVQPKTNVNGAKRVGAASTRGVAAGNARSTAVLTTRAHVPFPLPPTTPTRL